MSDRPGPRFLEARLALLLLLQFAIPAAWLPVVPPYLAGPLGFSPWQVGVLLAVPGLGAFAAPWLAGQLADRRVPAERLLAALTLATALALAGFAAARSYPWVLVCVTLQGLTFAPTLSLANAICLTHLPRPEESFGRVRLWGTVGWIAAGVAVGQWLLFAHTPPGDVGAVQLAQDAGRVDAIWFAAGLAVVAAIYAVLALPSTPPPPGALRWNAVAAAWAVLRRRPLLGMFLAGLPTACIDRFYLYHGAARLSEYGLGPTDAVDRIFGVGGGGLMTLGQLAEIAVLASLPLLLRRFGLRSLLRFGLFAFVARMVALAAFDHVVPVLLAVALHGVSYACFFFVGTLALDRHAPKDSRASAQALFLMVYGGFGSVVGSALASGAGAWATGPAGTDWGAVFAVPAGLGVLALALFAWGWPARPG